VASVLAAFSTSANMLIATRALLGVAGATVAPSTLSLIRNMFPDPQQRTSAIAVWLTSYSVGAVIGPLLGGLLLQYFWWGSVFLLAVPVMILVLIAGPILLPEYRDPNAGRLDVLSAGLSLTAVLAVIYGLKRIAADGFGWLPIAIIVGGLVVGYVFVRRQQRLADPLIDMRLFREPGFSAALATYMISVFVVFGMSLLTAQYLQLVLGLSPMVAGLWTLPGAVGFIVGSLSAPVMVRKVRAPTLMGGCLVATALGFVLLTQVHPGSRGGGLAMLVTGQVILSIAVAPVVTLATDLVVGSAPAEKAGAASAISETSAEFGGAVSIALIGSIATAVYRRAMAHMNADGIAPDVAESARSTLGGAVAAAEQLGDGQGARLLSSARDAFTDALQLTASINVVLSLAAAVMAAVLLRKVAAGGSHGQVQA
ncbi:MAG: MFS transporter, partial [Gemmatimonadaceae bacterium]